MYNVIKCMASFYHLIILLCLFPSDNANFLQFSKKICNIKQNHTIRRSKSSGAILENLFPQFVLQQFTDEL